ncbi:T-cell-specific surface glycoprotein CD28 [Channa argus]|uniref:T-cell-specific surface glycoprotein CD28 n=1 Tax=Channa argus TaxID=215402 RepID=UPI0029483B0B|nr:hypothetical protein Q8A73_023031 [Channa argus]
MSVYWIFVILLCSKLSHATHSHSTNTCDEKREPMCEPGKEEVHVPCPNISALEITLRLYKDHEVLFNLTCNLVDNKWNCPESESMAGVKLHEKLVSFILYGLTGKNQGIYKCEGTAIFPPPIITVPSNVSIHVHMEENNCKCCGIVIPENPSSEVMWIVVVALLSTYSLTVTTISLIIWLKMRKTDSQSDYMNTIPRAPKGRRRKRGFQYPIPRHF